MIFDIDKTEYIAIVAGMDCLPSVHVNEVIDHTYIVFTTDYYSIFYR